MLELITLCFLNDNMVKPVQNDGVFCVEFCIKHCANWKVFANRRNVLKVLRNVSLF